MLATLNKRHPVKTPVIPNRLRPSQMTGRVQSSAIRELFALLSQPGVISLAGGFPSTAAIDVNGIRNAMARAMSQSMPESLLYGSVQGYEPLRELIVDRCRGFGTNLDASGILITSGSQQGIDLVARTMIDPGDVVVVEAPTYLGALQAFQAQGAELVSVPTDADGINIEALKAVMDLRRPRLLYLIPNFANPTGAVLSLRRRRQVLALAVAYGVLVVEDDAYGELYFHEPPPPSLLSLARPEEREWLVHLSSFSKVLAPGLRLAWMTGPAELMKHVLLAKQISDTHASAISQMVAFHFLNAGSLEPALSRARHFYAKQSSAMQRAVEVELADFDVVTTAPKGGMFQWIDLPNVDAHALLELAIGHGVAFVPGPPFFVDGSGSSTLRLSFASVNVWQIEEGIRSLARAIRANR